MIEEQICIHCGKTEEAHSHAGSPAIDSTKVYGFEISVNDCVLLTGFEWTSTDFGGISTSEEE